MENKTKKIVLKIEQDTEKSINNANFLGDNRIRLMSEKLERFRNMLDSFLSNKKDKNFEKYIREIFEEIKWDETNLSQEDIDTNWDYKLFINYIYAILTNNNVSYDLTLDQSRYKKIYEDILKRINLLNND